MKEKQKLNYVKSSADIISCGTEEENKVLQDNTNTHNMIKDTVPYVTISPYLVQDQPPVKLDLSLLKYGLENMTEPKVLDCKFLSCMSLREYLPTFKDVDLFKIELCKRTLPPLAVSWNMDPLGRCVGKVYDEKASSEERIKQAECKYAARKVLNDIFEHKGIGDGVLVEKIMDYAFSKTPVYKYKDIYQEDIISDSKLLMVRGHNHYYREEGDMYSGAWGNIIPENMVDVTGNADCMGEVD